MHRKFAHLSLCSAQHNTDVEKKSINYRWNPAQQPVYASPQERHKRQSTGYFSRAKSNNTKHSMTQNYSIKSMHITKQKMFCHVQTFIRQIKYILWQLLGELLQMANEWVVDWSLNTFEYYVWMSKLITLGVEWLTRRSLVMLHRAEHVKVK